VTKFSNGPNADAAATFATTSSDGVHNQTNDVDQDDFDDPRVIGSAGSVPVVIFGLAR
jgi:hypothetical protein